MSSNVTPERLTREDDTCGHGEEPMEEQLSEWKKGIQVILQLQRK